MIGRFRQAWHYVFSRPADVDLRLAALWLSPGEFDVYRSMSLSDQAHSARVARRLIEAGAPGFAIRAGYLHDAGKPAAYGLFWRTLMVLWPGAPPEPEPPACAPLARARQIYHWHERYAADALGLAGSPPEVLDLIRGDRGTPWLEALQKADNQG